MRGEVRVRGRRGEGGGRRDVRGEVRVREGEVRVRGRRGEGEGKER